MIDREIMFPCKINTKRIDCEKNPMRPLSWLELAVCFEVISGFELAGQEFGVCKKNARVGFFNVI